MATNIRQFSSFAALAILALSAAPAVAHDRMPPSELEAASAPAPARLEHLVLYTGARLAFYGSESSPGSSCRERRDSETHSDGARAKEPAT